MENANKETMIAILKISYFNKLLMDAKTPYMSKSQEYSSNTNCEAVNYFIYSI